LIQVKDAMRRRTSDAGLRESPNGETPVFAE